MNKLYLLAALVALSACNTVEGLGKDITNMGYTLEKAAQEHQGTSKPASVQRSQQMNQSTLPQQTMQAVPVDPVEEKSENTFRFNGR